MKRSAVVLSLAIIGFVAIAGVSIGQQAAGSPILLPFMDSQGSWGFMDKSGKTVIPARFYEARPFREGFALVLDQEGATGYVDERGAFIWTVPKDGLDKALRDYGLAAFEEEFDAIQGDLGDFHEGLARVKVYSGAFQWRFGFIDRTGKFAIKAQFGKARDFSEGLAPVETPPQSGRYGYIRKDGTVAIKPEYENAYPFREGLAVVYHEESYGFIDKSGKTVFDLKFDRVGSFSEGLAAFGVRDPGKKATGFWGGSLDNLIFSGKWGFIDKSGNVVSAVQFDGAGDFAEGLAAVKKGALWGYIDQKGKLVIEAQFDSADSFSEGLAAVKKGGKWGYVDKTGRMAIGFQYDDAYSFSDGLAQVWTGDKMGYIFPTGKYFWGPSK
jgi:hypothetical protein